MTASDILDQINTLLGLPLGVVDKDSAHLDGEEAAEIAMSLVELLALRADPGVNPADVERFRVHVAREQARRREAAGRRELEILVATAWLRRRLAERKEWTDDELLALADRDHIKHSTLLAVDARAVRMKRRRITDDRGKTTGWMWCCVDKRPEKAAPE